MAKKLEYKWKDASYCQIPAQVVGKEITKVMKKNKGILTPQLLVDSAKNLKSPIHDYFEWNNKVAADKYRETQASYLIRHLEIIEEKEDLKPVKVRAFVSVKSDNNYHYVSIQSAYNDKDMLKYVLEQALSEYKALAQKYQNLKEFKKINDAINGIKI